MIRKEFFEYKTFVKKSVKKPDILMATKPKNKYSYKPKNVFVDSPVKNNVKINTPTTNNNKSFLT